MNRLTALVVDDEPLARRRVIRLLRGYEWIGPIEEAGNAEQACAMAATMQPDIVLLDIQMPGGDGFDVLARLEDKPPAVIFVTAFDHHALRAFEANAVDYVTKPIEPGRLHLALERARTSGSARSQADRIAEMQETIASLKTALQRSERRKAEFWVKSHGEYIRIAPEQVLRFQADRDYVRLHINGADYLYPESLTSLEGRLDADEFVRVHRSVIVRRQAIVKVRQLRFSALALVLTDGSEVRVGRTFVAGLRAELINMGGR